MFCLQWHKNKLCYTLTEIQNAVEQQNLKNQELLQQQPHQYVLKDGDNMKTLLTTLKSQLAGVISIILAFLFPIRGLIIAVGLAIVLDTIMGIFKAKKLNGWKAVSSKKLSAIISKMFLYQGAIILFYFMDCFILGEFIALFVGIPLFLTKVLAATLCFIEIKSIDENIEVITGKSVWDRFKELLARAKEAKEEISDLTESDKTN